MRPWSQVKAEIQAEWRDMTLLKKSAEVMIIAAYLIVGYQIWQMV